MAAAASRRLPLERVERTGARRFAGVDPQSVIVGSRLDEDNAMQRALRAHAFCIGLATVLSGCTSLLPTAKSEVVSVWTGYDDAVALLASFVPYTTTRADVHASGLDPKSNAAMEILHFADVMQRFSTAAVIEPESLDRGIRDCLQSGGRCSAYEVLVRKVKHDRIGSFWLDSLNFRRETVTAGWSVDALLIFVDDGLVYQLVGGQPTINEHELRRNPLGPLQGWGEHVVGAVNN